MGDYLPENEYSWEKLDNASKVLSNKRFTSRSSGYMQHKQAFQWLRGYFYQHNVT
jgi:hypothetical protein